MPRYGYGNDPADFYQGTGFDPYTGRMDAGAMVMAVLNQIAGRKKQKQQDEWDLEDRQAKQALLDMQRQGAALDLEGKRREAKDYVSPTQREQRRLFTEGIERAAEHKNRMAEIAARAAADKELAGMRKAESDKKAEQVRVSLGKEYKKARAAIESRYTSTLKDIEEVFTQNVAKTRGDPRLAPTESATPNQYTVALRGHHEARKRMRKEAETRYKEELKKLEESYKDALDVGAEQIGPNKSEAEAALPEGFVIR